MQGYIKTDVVCNMRNAPFLTLTESKVANTWYHEKLDILFALSESGFYVKNGSKAKLIKWNLI